jgi:hypothetical protein
LFFLQPEYAEPQTNPSAHLFAFGTHVGSGIKEPVATATVLSLQAQVSFRPLRDASLVNASIADLAARADYFDSFLAIVLAIMLVLMLVLLFDCVKQVVNRSSSFSAATSDKELRQPSCKSNLAAKKVNKVCNTH